MNTPLNVLLVEDSPDDAELLLAELHRASFEPTWKRVETEADFLVEIQKLPTIILSDYSMPRFSGVRAAQLLKESGLNIPFILISGTVGEDVAVEAMKHGATDYLLKDRIARLGSAIHRALEQQQLRKAREQAEREMRESERRFRELLENVALIAMTLDQAGRVTFCNNHLLQLTGWKQEEVVGNNWFTQFIPENDVATREYFQKHIQVGTIPPHHENPIRTKSGELREIVWNNTMLRDVTGNFIGTASIGEDVTERKHAEQALRASEERLRIVTENARVGLVMVNVERRYTFANAAYGEMMGFESGGIVGQPLAEVVGSQVYHEQIQPRLDRAFAGERVTYELHRTNAGQDRYYAVRYEPMKTTEGVSLVVVVITEITEAKQADEEIRTQLHELRRWHEAMLGREDRILELKREVNALLARQNLPPRYAPAS